MFQIHMMRNKINMIFDIEVVPQENLDPDPTLIPNQRPKWAKKLIEATGNVDGNPYEIRRTRS